MSNNKPMKEDTKIQETPHLQNDIIKKIKYLFKYELYFFLCISSYVCNIEGRRFGWVTRSVVIFKLRKYVVYTCLYSKTKKLLLIHLCTSNLNEKNELQYKLVGKFLIVS